MRYVLLLLSALVVSALAQGVTDNSSVSPSTEPSTPPSTPAQTTTPVPTVATTTAAPVTTTAAPVTTTAAASTTAPASTGTTASTTTSAATTVSPTPEVPVAGSWNVSDDNITMCVLLDMAMQFTITYNTSKAQIIDYINVPPNASASGVCAASNETQKMTLTWDPNYELVLSFENLPDSKYGLNTLTFDFIITTTDFKQKDQPLTANTEKLDDGSSSEFRISSGGSYKCETQQTIQFPNTTTVSPSVLVDVEVVATVSGFNFQAYRNVTVREYSTYEECSLDFSTSDIVPIAVGCALAALVVIVLIAYLIGRRRSRQKGYQSV